MKPEVVKDDDAAGLRHRIQCPQLQANLDIAVRQKMTKPFDVNTMIWKP